MRHHDRARHRAVSVLLICVRPPSNVEASRYDRSKPPAADAAQHEETDMTDNLEHGEGGWSNAGKKFEAARCDAKTFPAKLHSRAEES